jgi:hypothetical protein
MSNQSPHISNLKTCSASSVGCTPSRLQMTVPRAIPVMLAILVIPCFARLDRDFYFRAVTCPLDRAQDAPIRFIRDQSQQLSIFLVRLLKGESPISHSARVTHGISTPTNAAQQESSTIRLICSSGARRLWRVSRGPFRGPGPCKVHPPAPFSRLGRCGN